MIQPLPIHYNVQEYYESEPLLDYVREVTTNFWPEEYLIRFVTRLFDEEIANYKLDEYVDAATEKYFKHSSYRELHASKFKGAYTPNEQHPYSFVGLTRTFKAKVEEALNDGYPEHYFPDKASTSILMQGDETLNVKTFWYTYRDHVPYTVR